jgi:hypothetical protein
MADNIDSVIDELGVQGWKVERSANGHFKCYPPDPAKQMVLIARSNDHRAIRNAVSWLRKSGFVWPPVIHLSRTSVPVPVPGALGGRVELSVEVDPELRLPPKVETAHVAALPSTSPETPEERMDRLFQELKDARTLAGIATAHHAESQLALERAQAQLDAAHKEQVEAYASLKAKKAEFDAAFSAAGSEAA